MANEEIQAQIASIIQRLDMRPGLSLKKVQSLIQSAVTTATSSTITDETSVELVDNASGTEDAWTTIAAGAGSGATRVRLAVHLQGGPATCKLRQGSGQAEISLTCGTDTRYTSVLDIALAVGGTFDYYMDSATDNWAIDRIGYIT